MDVVNQRSATEMTIPDSISFRATSTDAEQVRRWSHRWVALAGCETPADVMAACRISDSFSDAALSALLRIVNGRYQGSPLAADILLQTLLPPAMRLHARPILHESSDPADAVGMLIAGIVEAITTYPLRRRLGVKEHLLDLAGMAFREKARTTTPAERAARSDVPYDRAALSRAGDVDEEVTADPLVQAAETLAAALRREAVSLAEARLVTRQHAFALSRSRRNTTFSWWVRTPIRLSGSVSGWPDSTGGMNAGDQRNALDRVNAEWAHMQTSPQAETQVRQWARRWPGLAGCESPADVEAACYRFDESSDAALLTLLRIVHGADAGRDLAARLVLHSVLGRAVSEFLPRLSRAFDDSGDAASGLLAAAVEAIATYPLDEPRLVKRRLLTRTGTLFRREARAFGRIDRRTQAVRGRSEIPCDPVTLGAAIDAIAEPTLDPLVEATEALAAAVRRHVISREDARLVARHHLVEQPVPYADLADELGISEAAVRQRCSRIVRRVAAGAVA